MNNNNKKSEDNSWKVKICLNPTHNFPTHLFIEPGETYTHVCPGCGQETKATGKIITC